MDAPDPFTVDFDPRWAKRRIVCLGKKWTDTTGLPLPVGVNVVKRSLGEKLLQHVSAIIGESMLVADQHRAEAANWAMQYSRQAEPDIGN